MKTAVKIATITSMIALLCSCDYFKPKPSADTNSDTASTITGYEEEAFVDDSTALADVTTVSGK